MCRPGKSIETEGRLVVARAGEYRDRRGVMVSEDRVYIGDGGDEFWS